MQRLHKEKVENASGQGQTGTCIFYTRIDLKSKRGTEL